jgi:nucleotide-binding universal stress UspA family protein
MRAVDEGRSSAEAEPESQADKDARVRALTQHLHERRPLSIERGPRSLKQDWGQLGRAELRVGDVFCPSGLAARDDEDRRREPTLDPEADEAQGKGDADPGQQRDDRTAQGQTREREHGSRPPARRVAGLDTEVWTLAGCASGLFPSGRRTAGKGLLLLKMVHGDATPAVTARAIRGGDGRCDRSPPGSCGLPAPTSRVIADGVLGPAGDDQLHTGQEEQAVLTTIVVGIDGREGGRDALALAERLRRLFGGELVAVHAYPYDFFVPRGRTPDFESVMHGNAQGLIADELERAGVSAHTMALPDGSPGRALRVAAKWHESDLIVVGSDHRGPIGRVLAGDVTAATLHGTRCPVVVAPRRYAEHGGDIRTIGVGYDGSPEAHAAARLAAELAEAIEARLRVILVLEPPTPGREGLACARLVLDDLLGELGEIATGEVVVGDAVVELSYAANDLDLLVTGSRGYGPVRRAMLGSTSSKLMHQAPCPVLVLPRTAVDEDDQAVEQAAAQPVAG